MKFLIQHNLISEKELLRVKDAIADYPHEFVGLIPFSHEITSEEPIVGTDYIPYGSTLFTELAEQYGWKGLHFNKEKFTYSEALRNRDDMLNGGVMTVADAITFFKSQDKTSQWFIRPNNDLKHFSGTVIDALEGAEWLTDAMTCASSGSYKMDSDMLVVVSKPKDIQMEWRYFVVGGKVVEGSSYRHNGRLRSERVTDADVLKEAQTYADKWLPDQCCAMDLALTPDGLYVIEINALNSSGFYACDTSRIFKALWEYHKAS